MPPMSEDTVEQAALEWLADIGYDIVHGPDIAPGEPAAERTSYTDVVLEGRLRDARLPPEPRAARRPPSTRPSAGSPAPTAPTSTPTTTPSTGCCSKACPSPTRTPRAAPSTPTPGSWTSRDGARQQRLAGRQPVQRPQAGRTRQPRRAPWKRRAGPTSCSSSTACRWPSSSSRTPPTRTPPCWTRSTSSRPTSRRSPTSSSTTRPWSWPTARTPVLGTLTAASSGSNAGAAWTARASNRAAANWRR